ncbi:MAG: hypothetical protein ACHQ5A_04240 [Opitutales bacterium]
MTEPEQPAPRQYELKPRTFERLNAEPGTQPASADHDVYAIRASLRAREQAAGMDELVPLPPKKSRRRRDYWLLLLANNAVLLLVLILGRHNVVVAVYALSGMVLLSVGLTWVMWQIMEDY